MSSGLLIKHVRQTNGEIVDIRIADGRIQAIDPELSAQMPDENVIDGENRLLFTGFVDAHTHMDKTLIGMGWYRNEVGPTLIDKIDNERWLRVERDIDAHQQSSRHARL